MWFVPTKRKQAFDGNFEPIFAAFVSSMYMLCLINLPPSSIDSTRLWTVQTVKAYHYKMNMWWTEVR